MTADQRDPAATSAASSTSAASGTSTPAGESGRSGEAATSVTSSKSAASSPAAESRRSGQSSESAATPASVTVAGGAVPQRALEAIARSRVIAVLRASDASRFGAIAGVLAQAGIRCIEFTLSSAGALDALAAFAADLPPGVELGAGTVLDADTAQAAVDAGATYLLAPTGCPDVVARGNALGVPVIPGAFTPSEILTAWRSGASAVKLFPASLGGPDYLRAVAAPLPGIPLVPTGGISVEAAPAYLAAGALAVGLGGPLVGDGRDLGALRDRAQRLVSGIAEHTLA